jgi:N-acetylmuramoyl-L-alanine amidase
LTDTLGANVGGQSFELTGTGVTVTTQPQPPSVHIDFPAPASTVSGLVTVSGWAVDNAAFIRTAIGSVQVLADGIVVGNATYGISRSDVCNAYPGPGCPNVGFEYKWNTAALAPGQHTITILASDVDETPDTGTASVLVTVAPVLPTVVIDSPAPGSVLAGSTLVSGWALNNTSAIGTAVSGVKVKVDGVVVGNATYGINRLDVCIAYPGRTGCPNVGFSYLLNLASLSAGPHTITVSATDSGGIPEVGSSAVPITVANVPPSVYIDSPAPGAVLSGSVAVTGWALDNATAIGSAISSVKVKVDGVEVGTATYGTSRPDVCSAYAGRPGCPNVGFTYALNTATLSPGTHLLAVSATDSDTNPDSGTWSISFQVAPLPNVRIDSPADGATVSGPVAIAGWAIDNTSAAGTAISSVRVLVDGATVGTATYGISRPDVCSAYPARPSCPNVGFAYQLDTAPLSPGKHKITIAATNSDGSPKTGMDSVTVTVAAIPPTVHIDTPLPASALSGTVAVSGWALDNRSVVGTAIGNVQVLLDGVPVGNAIYGQSRPDVCSAYPARPGCPNVGFTYQLSLTALSSGSHTITVSATDTDGTPDVGTDSVQITVVNVSPSVYIDSPAPGEVLRGVVTVEGWALDDSSAIGAVISRVQVKVDGVAVGATYGISRPDACTAYAGRPGCPNVGFTYTLDTTVLNPGSHLLTVSAMDTDAAPGTGSWSIAIQVPAPHRRAPRVVRRMAPPLPPR